MDISPEIMSWCAENGFTEPQIVDGKVWAYSSLSVMPVPIGMTIKKDVKNLHAP
jgi:hypothetical protein